MDRNIFFIKSLIAIGLMALSFTAFSQNSSEATSETSMDCSQEGFTFKNNAIVFNPDNKPSHRVFLIHNATSGAIVVNQLNIMGVMGGAGWTSKIDSGQWSALAMSQPNLSLNCESFSPPYYRIMDCKSGLNVCSYQSKTNIGSFWIIENTSFLNVVKTLKLRNIMDLGSQ